MEGIESLAAGPQAESLTGEGMYIYCVAGAGAKTSLGHIGIEGSEVHTIPYEDLCAVVHSCPAQPYRSAVPEIVEAWAVAHQGVIEAAWEQWGTVLPMSFDTVIRGEPNGSAGRSTEDWLRQEYENLKRGLDRLKGKAEYGVQVFWDNEIIVRNIMSNNDEIKRLEAETRSQPRGLAYMYRQKLEGLVKREMEARADQCFKDLYQRIRKHTAGLRVEKTKKGEPGLQMLMNLSCLVCREAVPALGEELDAINRTEGFPVRFTGPWPPYSFVDRI